MADPILNIGGAVALAVGVFTAYKAGQRRFARTNEYRVKRTRTYWDGLRDRAIDKLLALVALTLIGGGVTTLAWTHLDTWGGIVMLPIAIVVLFALVGS